VTDPGQIPPSGRFWRLYCATFAGLPPSPHRQRGTFGNTWRDGLWPRTRTRCAASGGRPLRKDEGVDGRSAVTISRYTGGGVIVCRCSGNAPEPGCHVPTLGRRDRRQGRLGVALHGWAHGGGEPRPLAHPGPILGRDLPARVDGLDKRRSSGGCSRSRRIPADEEARAATSDRRWTQSRPGQPTAPSLVKARARSRPSSRSRRIPEAARAVVCGPRT